MSRLRILIQFVCEVYQYGVDLWWISLVRALFTAHFMVIASHFIILLNSSTNQKHPFQVYPQTHSTYILKCRQ